MSRGWRRGEAFCSATNRDGKPCGNKVKVTDSGAIIYRQCALHRRLAERKQREARS